MADSEMLGNHFIQQARSHLSHDSMPKIKRCIDLLDEGDIWWRSHVTDNSIGNLILHLSGNVRQWVIAGVGGKPDVRERPKEFSQRDPLSKESLWQALENTMKEADQVLDHLSPEKLLERKTIQGFDQTFLQVILHVVEHFSFHTGQIIYITKLRKGVDLKFYNL
ncbi:MAG: DUF1572 family protein [Terriglobia bacterium]